MNNISDLELLFNTMTQLGKLISQHTHLSHEEKAATLLQFSALKFIRDNKNTTVSDLAEKLQLSKSSATQLSERLVKSSSVKRINDTSDRRIVRLEITEAGREQIVELKRKMIEKMKKVFSKIPAKDIRELIRIHNDLIETLKKEHNN